MKVDNLNHSSAICPFRVQVEEELDDLDTLDRQSTSSIDSLERPPEEEMSCCAWITNKLYSCFISPIVSCWNWILSFFFTPPYLTLENFKEITAKLDNPDDGVDEKTFAELLNWALDNPEAFEKVYDQIEKLNIKDSKSFIDSFDMLSDWAIESIYKNKNPTFYAAQQEVMENDESILLKLSRYIAALNEDKIPNCLKPLLPKMKDFIAKNSPKTLIEQYKALPNYFRLLLKENPNPLFLQFFKEWLENPSYINDWIVEINAKASKESGLSLKDYLLRDIENNHPIAQILNNSTILKSLENIKNSDDPAKATYNIVHQISLIFQDQAFTPIVQQVALKIGDTKHPTFANQMMLALKSIGNG